MNSINFIRKKMVAMIALLFLTIVSFAQDAAQQANVAAVKSSNNQLETLLVVTVIVLAFVIWGMGQAVIAIGKLSLEKYRREKNVIPSVLLIVALSLFSHIAFAQDATNAAAETVKEIPNYGGLSSTAYYTLVFVITIEIATILFLAFFIKRMYTELLPEKQEEARKKSKLIDWWSNLDKKVFTKAIPVEREADFLLDHDYDGIKELDNALPPWWKYGFYITIFVAVIYLLNFHVFGSGKNPTQEYEAEMEQANIDKAEYDAKNKDKIDEAHVPMADAAGLQQAKTFFLTDCWPCHGKMGEGGAGPNLTDDYWLHKGSLNDVFQSIKHGYPEKGMQSWAVKYNPKEISLLASYVKSLHGTNPPNPKAPQGDLFVENATADSTAKK